MFAVNTYDEIVKNERLLNEKHIVIFLFVRPSLKGANEVINEFNYLHYNSGKFCSIYAVGYTNGFNVEQDKEYKKVAEVSGANWYYSDSSFVEFKNNLEKRLKWKYSGEIEMLVLQTNPEGRDILNFQNYVAVDVNYGIRNEYIDSFPRFMESLIRSTQTEITAKQAIIKVNKSRYSIKNIMLDSIELCKRVPTPVRQIIKDNLFYLT